VERDFIGLIQVFVSEAAIAPGNSWLEDVVTALKEADIYVVLCSQLSVDRRWINIELGAGLSRGKRIIPICHTDLNTTQLQRPLADYQSVNASDVEGLRRLYQILAAEIGSGVPSANFEELAGKVKEFEERHRRDKAVMMESVDAASATSSTDIKLPHPRVLCVSSKQFEETVGKDLELIRRSFPDVVQHELSVTAADVRRLLVDNVFDIVHVAAYICPVHGDIIFSEVDQKNKIDVSGKPDLLGPEQFAQLVKASEAKLVVLANNETTVLLARLLPVTNVAFALGPMDLKTLRDWIQEFYRLLASGRTLSDACRKAFAQYQTPMRLYPRLPVERSAASAA
jgi:hypothetical protein